MACVVVSSLALPHSVTLTVHTQLAGGGVALSERGHVSLSCKVGHAHEIRPRNMWSWNLEARPPTDPV